MKGKKTEQSMDKHFDAIQDDDLYIDFFLDLILTRELICKNFELFIFNTIKLHN